LKEKKGSCASAIDSIQLLAIIAAVTRRHLLAETHSRPPTHVERAWRYESKDRNCLRRRI
jgi:hypothetical protein